MKWLKLFEDFGSKDIVEDIKSISYILEDKGYELGVYNWKNAITHGNEDFDQIIINIKLWTEQYVTGVGAFTDSSHENLMKKVESDIDNYKNLLMEHLDYTPSDKFHVGKITHRIGSQVSFSKESVRFECKIKIDVL
jgi:menaquinone-dependent protoporphyrinogen IX oxidase